MSKKFRRFYETAFDAKISKSDDDLLSADKEDAAIAYRLSNQLQLSVSTSSVVQHRCNGGGVSAPSSKPAAPCKNRLFGFLLHRKRWRRNSGGGGPQQFQAANDCGKYLSSDSVVTGSSFSLESITSDSLSSHSSESPCYKSRFPEPHVLSPISDKSSLDAAAADVPLPQDSSYNERRRSCAAGGGSSANKTKPPQSLGLIKLNRDQQQQHHHGSDSGISVGSKPGDCSYQEELSDVPFDMPKLRRKQKSEVDKQLTLQQTVQSRLCAETPLPLEPLPFDMPKLRRKQTDSGVDVPFDMPKLRKRQMDSCARVMSMNFETGAVDGGLQRPDDRTTKRRLEGLQLPFDVLKLQNIDAPRSHEGGMKKPDRSSLFLDVTPNNHCSIAADSVNSKPSLKTFQNKNQPNRPTLSLSNIKPLNYVEDIDVSLPLDQQCWYHGPINRLEAEKALYGEKEGSYLVRGNKGSYALSIKSAKGFIHIRIIQSGNQNYLGQSDRPFDAIPDLIRHYTLNKLPVKGAEHVGLIRPLALQIL